MRLYTFPSFYFLSFHLPSSLFILSNFQLGVVRLRSVPFCSRLLQAKEVPVIKIERRETRRRVSDKSHTTTNLTSRERARRQQQEDGREERKREEGGGEEEERRTKRNNKAHEQRERTTV